MHKQQFVCWFGLCVSYRFHYKYMYTVSHLYRHISKRIWRDPERQPNGMNWSLCVRVYFPITCSIFFARPSHTASYAVHTMHIQGTDTCNHTLYHIRSRFNEHWVCRTQCEHTYFNWILIIKGFPMVTRDWCSVTHCSCAITVFTSRLDPLCALY